MLFSKRTARIRGLIIADPEHTQDTWCVFHYRSINWETHVLWTDVFKNFTVVCPD